MPVTVTVVVPSELLARPLTLLALEVSATETLPAKEPAVAAVTRRSPD